MPRPFAAEAAALSPNPQRTRRARAGETSVASHHASSASPNCSSKVVRRALGPRTRARLVALMVACCLLVAPVTALAQKGQKSYRQGLQHEAAQQWEQAAEQFALALAAEPSNVEYQLHFRRAVFNASQAFMQQGRTLSERGDYIGAYNAFRRAHSYDASNELALSLMERMQRLQLEKDGEANPTRNAATPATAPPPPLQFGAVNLRASAVEDPPALSSPRTEQLRAINFDGELEDFVRFIARQVDINVIFDRDFPKRHVKVDLREVTAAQALDHVFFSQGLFFQKLSRRTILVADQSKRPQYQQLVLRTFYLSNVDPADAQKLIQAAIPPQAGRLTIVATNKTTNSITVRDTRENVRLIGELVRGIDKERAEVVMDVNIYEVSRNDLFQLGHQMGTEASLSNLGGITKGFGILGGSREVVTQGLGAIAAPTALGAALVIPASTLNALQRKDQTRLIASTQLHAFDGERSTAHIGQRVPVQTAAVAQFGSVGADDKNAQPNVNTGVFGGSGYPVIQYEKTGLTLEFTPQVFQNLDVQVKMIIKSNDVASQSTATLTPTFTERNIEGTARIRNNQTMMIASVAQNQQSRGRQGVPLLGLVPVLGRFFTAPRRADQQTDIVIAVTPHVMRAPSVTPQDEDYYPSGTLQTPTSESLEAVLQDLVREDQFAAARSIPTNRVVQLPDAEEFSFVPAPTLAGPPTPTRAARNDGETRAAQPVAQTATHVNDTSEPRVVREAVAAAAPAPAAAEAVYSNQSAAVGQSDSLFSGVTSRNNAAPPKPAEATRTEARPAEANVPASSAPASRVAQLRLVPERPEMRVGERQTIRLFVKTDASLNLVVAMLRFDPRVLAVRSVSRGSTFPGAQGAPVFSKAVNNEAGSMLVSVLPLPGDPPVTAAGTLLSIEVEALAGGSTAFSVDAQDPVLMASDNSRVQLKHAPILLTVSK
ncbi:MAG TPA: secretin N-terminal domain-containing protein [Pyrinomonadaceae bacterium]|nr:secretin N-terminal domain-containing protein [Pyrinomonadaceae bacterium]